MSSPRDRHNCAKKTQILIVEDHPLLRAGLVQLIRSEPDLDVCCEAASAEDGWEAVISGIADFVITDITLPGKSGMELLKDIRATRPELPVLVMSMHDEALYAERVLQAGGGGYLMKNEGSDKVLLAIRRVLKGKIYLSEGMNDRIVERCSGRNASPDSHGPESFSDRELEVYQLIGKGTSTKRISELLHVSTKTVDTHRANLKMKLNLKTTQELICHAANAAALASR